MSGPSIRKDHRFIEALKRAMRLIGMSQADVAREIGVGRATVYGWLNGSEPSDGNFKNLVRLFPDLSKFGDS